MITPILLFGFSGVPSLFLPRGSAAGQRTATATMVLGSAIGLLSALRTILSGSVEATLRFPWPAEGGSSIGTDPLSAFFLVPIFFVGALGSVYGLGYWSARRHPGNARKVQFFWGAMSAGMTLLVVARHAVVFLLGWELMALSAFFLVSTEDENTECRRAGYVYLIATHLGTLALFALFALWRWTTGSFLLIPAAPGLGHPGASSAMFLLALFAFGLKAGLMPLHFWLPGAHANAPTHVSAFLSGVLLKIGVYGLLRVTLLLPSPPAGWGGLLLGLGAASGVLGVLFALGQHDLKRLLAYHSVENIGIIFMGLGLALLGRATGHRAWFVLGMAGGLLHVWNHSFFKSLLFFGAGSVIRSTGTRRMDALGGLAKTMPWTAAAFLVGAAAICGLPPLNGFLSELFIYLGLFSPLVSGEPGLSVGSALAAPALAMIGALAVACFVKAYGGVFLGSPRTEGARGAVEAPLSMLLPMFAFAAICVLIGVAPFMVVPLLDPIIAGASSVPLPSLADYAPLKILGVVPAALVAGIALVSIATIRAARRGRKVGTWDCGYARPTERMQYTASSFARSLVSTFIWVLRPRERSPRVVGVFPGPTDTETHVDDAVLERLLIPGTRGAIRWAEWFRRFQQGLTQHYILYIVVALTALMCTLIPFKALLSYLILP